MNNMSNTFLRPACKALLCRLYILTVALQDMNQHYPHFIGKKTKGGRLPKATYTATGHRAGLRTPYGWKPATGRHVLLSTLLLSPPSSSPGQGSLGLPFGNKNL